MIQYFTWVWQERPNIINNPVIRRELIERLRKRSMFVYAAILLSIFWLISLLFWHQILNSFYLHSNFTVRSAFLSFSAALAGFILFLVPILSANSLNMEFERDSWDLLKTTHLNNASIVLGKFLSSIVVIWLICLSLIPFFSILLSMGSVAPDEIIVAILLLSELILIFALIGLVCSAYFQRTISAITAAYFFSLFYLVGIPLLAIPFERSLTGSIYLGLILSQSPIPVAFSYYFNTINFADIQMNLSDFYLLHIFIALFTFLLLYLLCMGLLAHRTRGKTRTALNYKVFEFSRPSVQWKREFRTKNLLPDFTNPILFKEKVDQYVRHYIWNRATFLFLFLFTFGLLVLKWSNSFGGSDELLYYLLVLITPFFIVPYAVNTFCEEKDRDTWDLLRSTTITAYEILWGKWLAGFQLFLQRYGIVFGIIFFHYIILHYITPDTPYQHQPSYPTVDFLLALNLYTCLILCSCGVFYLCLAHVFSYYSANTTSAYVKTILVILMQIGGFPIILYLLSGRGMIFTPATAKGLASLVSPLSLIASFIQYEILSSDWAMNRFTPYKPYIHPLEALFFQITLLLLVSTALFFLLLQHMRQEQSPEE
jgi:ABC-type transport system involved in multi-copper enzyme maturation permease subunit